VIDQTVVAKVFVQNTAGQLLLVRRSKTDTRRPLEWDIPGGMVEANEFVEEAAARETLEETGLVVDAHQLKLVSTYSITYDQTKSVHRLFFTGAVTSNVVVLSDEHSEWQWLSPEDALTVLTYDVQHNALQYALDNNLLG